MSTNPSFGIPKGGSVTDTFVELVDAVKAGKMHVHKIDYQMNSTRQMIVVELVLPGPVPLAYTPPPPTATKLIATAGATGTPGGVPYRGVRTEPVTGFRDFELALSAFGPLLVSRNKKTIWPRREAARAFCHEGPLSAHDAPSENCECGFYAFSTPDHKDLKRKDAIWGEIWMWGEVLVCAEGFRSEYAYPKNLFLRDNGTQNARWLQERLSIDYGIPVFLVAEREGKTAEQVIAEILSSQSFMLSPEEADFWRSNLDDVP